MDVKSPRLPRHASLHVPDERTQRRVLPGYTTPDNARADAAWLKEGQGDV